MSGFTRQERWFNPSRAQIQWQARLTGLVFLSSATGTDSTLISTWQTAQKQHQHRHDGLIIKALVLMSQNTAILDVSSSSDHSISMNLSEEQRNPAIRIKTSSFTQTSALIFRITHSHTTMTRFPLSRRPFVIRLSLLRFFLNLSSQNSLLLSGILK